MVKLDEQSKQNVGDAINEDLQLFTDKISKRTLFFTQIAILLFVLSFLDNLIAFIKESKLDDKILTDLQQSLRPNRWSKQAPVCYFLSDVVMCEISFSSEKKWM